MAKIASRTFLTFMRLFRPIEYYLLVVDILRSYYLVVQVDFYVLRIIEDNSYMQEKNADLG